MNEAAQCWSRSIKKNWQVSAAAIIKGVYWSCELWYWLTKPHLFFQREIQKSGIFLFKPFHKLIYFEHQYHIVVGVCGSLTSKFFWYLRLFLFFLFLFFYSWDHIFLSLSIQCWSQLIYVSVSASVYHFHHSDLCWIDYIFAFIHKI